MRMARALAGIGRADFFRSFAPWIISRLRQGDGRVQGSVRILAQSTPSGTSASWIRIVARPITTRSISSRMMLVCEVAWFEDGLAMASVTSASTTPAGIRTIVPALLISPCRATWDT
jgi:hypothetical protein